MDEQYPKVDEKALSLLRYFRQKGFDQDEVELITAVASPEVIKKSSKGYQEYLQRERGVFIPLKRVRELRSDPDFQECVELLWTQEKGASLRAIEKTMMSRATDPTDSHGVAAARLVFQANGLLRDDKNSAGSAEQQFVSVLLDIREGRLEINGQIGQGRRRGFEVEGFDRKVQLEEKTETENSEANRNESEEEGEEAQIIEAEFTVKD